MKKTFKKFTVVFLAVLVAAFASGCKKEEAPTTTVKEETPKSSISVDKSSYDAGEDIEITYNIVETVGDSAWVGIVPSDTPHGSEDDGDAADVNYAYLYDSTAGSVSLRAPGEGNWDARIYSSDDVDGVELASTSFKVNAEPEVMEETEEEATLSLSETTFATGDEVVVQFTAPESFDSGAWVGLVPSDTPHGSEDDNDAADISYEYVNGRTSGEMTFTAPEAGSWDLRMNDSDQEGAVEVASVTFTVE